MWNYEKRLQYPVNIKEPNAKLAQIIMSQYGGPDGEMGASMRYLSQRFTAPNRVCMAVLTDVATEELGHLEMVSTIVHQLTANLTVEEIEKQVFRKRARRNVVIIFIVCVLCLFISVDTAKVIVISTEAAAAFAVLGKMLSTANAE